MENEQLDYISQESIDRLTTIESELLEYYKTPISEDLEPEEKKKLINVYHEKIKEYGRTLSETSFKLKLTLGEYLFLKNTILTGLEYDRQNIFVALMVKDDFFVTDNEKSPVTTSIEFENDGNEKTHTFEVNINTLTRISHLLSLYKSKGLMDSSSNCFANVVRKTIDISRVFDVYNKKGESIQIEGDNWLKFIP